MTGRRRDPAGMEPLFGEDWWVSDQQLFQDSLARQAAPCPVKPKTARRTTLQRKTRAASAGIEQPMLPWFEEPEPDPAGDAGEPLRSDGAGALGSVAADPVRGDQRSGQLLLGPWDTGGAADREPGGGPGRGRPARRELPGKGGPAEAKPGTGRSRWSWPRRSCWTRNREPTRTRSQARRSQRGAWSSSIRRTRKTARPGRLPTIRPA